MSESEVMIQEPIPAKLPLPVESSEISEPIQNLDEATPASKGGKARMQHLSPSERKALAGNASRARWKKQKAQEQTQAIHCPACAAGLNLERGEGSHIMPSAEHPIPAPQSANPNSALHPNPMPKEFNTALVAAERRLAKAIEERAKAANAWAVLQAEIPFLERTIAVLRGHPVTLPPAAVPNFASTFPLPNSWEKPAVQHQPQISKAQGGAVANINLSGPEDDEDRFLRESGLPSGEWH